MGEVRARDAATVGKRAGPSPVALDAERVAKSGASPRYTRDDYHDEMMSISKRQRRHGEDAVSAFARLCGEGRFDDLYAAGERAEAAEVGRGRAGGTTARGRRAADALAAGPALRVSGRPRGVSGILGPVGRRI